MRHRLLFPLLAGALVIVACHIGPGTEDKIADGDSCIGHIDQCKSGSCINDLCQGSGCESAADCNEGWVCYHGQSSSDFFGGGGGPFTQCRASCDTDGGGCPVHQKCSLDGTTCETDPQWSIPVVTITASIDVDAAVLPGTTVTLHGEATSPVGDDALALSWSVPDDDGKTSHGDTTHDVSVHPTSPSSAYPVELNVTDSKNRRGSAFVHIKVCGTADFFCAGSDPSDIPCCPGLSCKSFKCQP